MAKSLKEAYSAALVGRMAVGQPGVREPATANSSAAEQHALPARSSISPQPSQPRQEPPPKPAPWVLRVGERASFALPLTTRSAMPVELAPLTVRHGTQAHASRFDNDREVVMGLDFGTSCVKTVIGDAALGRAFAVPYCKATGIDAFLLPSVVYQTGEVFGLQGGTAAHRDLKLALLACPEDADLQRTVVAFLALVIRRARSWFLAEHAATYKRTRIFWKLALGLPAALHLRSDLAALFERLGVAAWWVAGKAGDVTATLIDEALGPIAPQPDANLDAEVTVVPEIAAQIYGFVMSNSFDRHAANIYLMADVGAGTVDSALFQVKPGRGGRWDFWFYTCVVEPNGVSNLHRHRVNWWSDALSAVQAPGHLAQALLESKLPTDLRHSAPESFHDYFRGVTLDFAPGARTPDDEFFRKSVTSQVRGRTLWRTWKDGLLSQGQLNNVPFFMCGGGVRMSYYRRLEDELANFPGYSWLRAERWVMEVPADLEADGVSEDDYDRLSVGYGLSRLEVGKVVKALPLPKLPEAASDRWRENYVDKDQV